MTKKKTRAVSRKVAGTPKAPSLHHELHTLLSTMRSITQNEDRLCELLHEVRMTNRVTDELAGELEQVLDSMPLSEYEDDLERVRKSLQAQHGAKSRISSNNAAPAAKRAARKGK